MKNEEDELSKCEDLKLEAFDIIKSIQDPEKAQTLEELDVVNEDLVNVKNLYEGEYLIDVQFVPTVPHCSLASLIVSFVSVMDRLCDILGAVQKSSGSTFLSCEPELVELMRQIDGMVEAKRHEWLTENNMLNNELKRKSEETKLYMNRMEDLDKQVKLLRQQLLNERNNHKNVVTEYDSHVNKLKSDVSEMRKKHERLLKKNEKFHQHKNEKSREFSERISLLSQDNLILKDQMNALREKNQSLTECNEELEKRLAKCELDIERRKEIYLNFEIDTAKEMAVLQKELGIAREKIRNHEIETEKTEHACKDLKKHVEQSKEENGELCSQLSSLNNIKEKLENIIALKDKKINQLKHNLEKVNLSRNENNIPLQQNSEKISPFKNRIKELDFELIEVKKELDEKLASLQLCETKCDRLRMDNDYLRSVLKIYSTSHENTSMNGVYGISDLERENSELFRKLKSLQVEFASTVDDGSSEHSVPLLNDEFDQTNLIETFLNGEKEREVELANKIAQRIKDFDEKCHAIISMEDT